MLKQPNNANKISTHFLTTTLPTAQPAIHITYNKSTVEHRLFCKRNKQIAQNCSRYTRYKCCTEALSKRHATIFHRPCTDKHLATKLTVKLYATQTSWVLRMLSDKSIISKTNVTFSWLGYNNHSHYGRRSKRGLTSWKTTTQNRTVRSIYKEITLRTTSTLKVATYKGISIPIISSFANPKSFLATHSKTRFTQQQSNRQSLKKGAQDNLRKVPAAYQTESELSLLTTKDKKDKQQLLSSLHA